MQTFTTSDTSISEKIKRIEELNLEPIMVKLMDEEEGEGWTLEQTLAAEKWYKRFLILSSKYADQSIVPNKQVDTFWHYHILDTMKYEEDCQSALGYFLHHFPYFGMRGKQDAENLNSAFNKTLELMKKEFGECLTELAVQFNEENKSSICDDSPNCYGSGCTGSKCGSDDRTYERPTLSLNVN